ncbi:YunG family protein [Nocardia aurea]|uniref:Uncharacterized protein n=1 Tax=Nocardia aurea TaxID=2144174 RepID=A0ABV3FPN4_9NOCA
MGTIDVEALAEALQASWSAETSSASGWTATNPAKGQCAVTACVAQDYLGGEILNSIAVLPDGGTVSHYFNIVDGRIIDLTKQQFPGDTRLSDPAPKTRGFASTRDYCLSYRSTEQRYTVLSRRIARLVGSPT